MKEFILPEIQILDDIILEPVYAASGTTPDKPTPPPPAGGDLNVTPQWRNHNSGSHSELAIVTYCHAEKGGECITFHFTCYGFALDYIKDSGGFIISDVSETGFSLTRVNHFNNNERIEFNIQLVAKDSPYHGSVGKTGEEVVGPQVICTGYEIS